MKKLFSIIALLFVALTINAADRICGAYDLANPDTEYSLIIPQGARFWAIQCKESKTIRISFVTGYVANPASVRCISVKSGSSFSRTEVLYEPLTVYVATSAAPTQVEYYYD